MVSWSAQQNTQQWLQQMYRVPQAVRDEIDRVNAKAAQDTANRLKTNIPVHPEAPHLKDTIRVEAGDTKLLEHVVKVGSNTLYYAPFLEHGHANRGGGRVPGEKFFWPVVRLMNKRWKQRSRRAIRKAVASVFGGRP